MKGVIPSPQEGMTPLNFELPLACLQSPAVLICKGSDPPLFCPGNTKKRYRPHVAQDNIFLLVVKLKKLFRMLKSTFWMCHSVKVISGPGGMCMPII